jgi:hypothetical protein
MVYAEQQEADAQRAAWEVDQKMPALQLPDPCGVHVRLHADIVTQADGMPSEIPASLPAAPWRCIRPDAVHTNGYL